MGAVDYSLLFFSSFVGGVSVLIAKDFYEFVKKKYRKHRVRAKRLIRKVLY